MKIQINLNVTSEEFFKVLMDSLEHEAKEIKKTDDVKLEKGLKYNKQLVTKLGTTVNAKFEVIELTPNEKYHSRIKHKEDTIDITYLINSQGNTINLLYLEEYESDKKRKSINNSIVGTIMSPFLKRSKKKQFKAMENYIIQNRKN